VSKHIVTVRLVKTRHQYEGICSGCTFEVYVPNRDSHSEGEANRHASFHEAKHS